MQSIIFTNTAKDGKSRETAEAGYNVGDKVSFNAESP